MRQIIVGNWKMYLARERGIELVRELAAAAPALDCDLVVCPPFPMIHPLALALEGSAIAVGGQDCHQAVEGAFTGDVAAPMLTDAGATYVILGHSERRQYHSESDALVRAKSEAARRAGLIPIICVGETAGERALGQEQAIIASQLHLSLPDHFRGIVAYEPIWAIGTGRTPTPADVAAMHLLIRRELVIRFGAAGQQIPLLYGGSVKPANAAQILATPHVNGALVGGASLTAEAFLGIARAR